MVVIEAVVLMVVGFSLSYSFNLNDSFQQQSTEADVKWNVIKIGDAAYCCLLACLSASLPIPQFTHTHSSVSFKTRTVYYFDLVVVCRKFVKQFQQNQVQTVAVVYRARVYVT